MNMLVIVGSLREKSYNLQLAHTMQERYKANMTLNISDIRSLPHFNQDEEQDPPQAVKDFKKAIADADGVIIVTPEYNWSIPGVLKNAIDWASRVDKVFIGKPVLALGVTMGALGTIRAQLHLREILASQQARMLPPAGNEVLINFAPQKFDEQAGRLTDEDTLTFLDGTVKKFIHLVESN